LKGPGIKNKVYKSLAYIGPQRPIRSLSESTISRGVKGPSFSSTATRLIPSIRKNLKISDYRMIKSVFSIDLLITKEALAL
jgi:hypothetical protein